MARRPKSKTSIARELRRDGTDVERLLWSKRREGLPRWKFRRQHPIGRRIADFACPGAKLAIELDGGRHGWKTAADEQRNAELAQCGYRVIRFWNNEILENLDGVLAMVSQALQAAPISPSLSAPQGRRGAAQI